MKKIVAVFIALFFALAAFAMPASATGGGTQTGTSPTQNLKCDVLVADYKRELKNGDHINMTIKDSTGEYQVNAYVDLNLGGYKDMGIRYSDGTTKKLNKNEVERGVITFNYGEKVKASPYTVKFIQTNETDTWPDFTCGGSDEPNPSNKKVEVCHATSSATNSYVFLRLPVEAFLNRGHSGHENDIYEGFTYTTKGGETVNVPGKNTDKLYLLDADPKCVEPRTDEEIVKPTPVITDLCENDKDDFAVPGGRGYTVGERTGTYPNWSITVTADTGFVFPGGEKSATFTTGATDFPNSADCDLPETGGEAKYNVNMGIGAVAGLLLLGAIYMLVRRKA